MLITRAKAEEAAEILGLAPIGTHVINVDCVKSAYKEKAKEAHPDAGGSAEAFARVDWAKHVMIKWLGQDISKMPEHKRTQCTNCNGTGYIQTMIGFKMRPRKQCQPCRGTGDADFEPDEGEAR